MECSLIGFLAKRKRGKDTACDYLVNMRGCVKRSFAGPLKKGIQEFFGFTDNQLYTDKKDIIDENWGISPREAFQKIGTDVIRDSFSKLFPTIKVDQGEFWIKNFDIWYQKNKNNRVVVSDVRYQNEVDYILSKGGIVIKIDGPCRNSDTNTVTDNHKSEVSIDKIINYSALIMNNGTIEEFHNKLITL